MDPGTIIVLSLFGLMAVDVVLTPFGKMVLDNRKGGAKVRCHDCGFVGKSRSDSSLWSTCPKCGSHDCVRNILD
ncbi:MAG: hypothetical protein CMH54_01275 [Myxococcales bacterium]|nr:hypothetical protein [Myxococcales bacterium]